MSKDASQRTLKQQLFAGLRVGEGYNFLDTRVAENPQDSLQRLLAQQDIDSDFLQEVLEHLQNSRVSLDEQRKRFGWLFEAAAEVQEKLDDALEGYATRLAQESSAESKKKLAFFVESKTPKPVRDTFQRVCLPVVLEQALQAPALDGSAYRDMEKALELKSAHGRVLDAWQTSKTPALARDTVTGVSHLLNVAVAGGKDQKCVEWFLNKKRGGGADVLRSESDGQNALVRAFLNSSYGHVQKRLWQQVVDEKREKAAVKSIVTAAATLDPEQQSTLLASCMRLFALGSKKQHALAMALFNEAMQNDQGPVLELLFAHQVGGAGESYGYHLGGTTLAEKTRFCGEQAAGACLEGKQAVAKVLLSQYQTFKGDAKLVAERILREANENKRAQGITLALSLSPDTAMRDAFTPEMLAVPLLRLYREVKGKPHLKLEDAKNTELKNLGTLLAVRGGDMIAAAEKRLKAPGDLDNLLAFLFYNEAAINLGGEGAAKAAFKAYLEQHVSAAVVEGCVNTSRASLKKVYDHCNFDPTELACGMVKRGNVVGLKALMRVEPGVDKTRVFITAVQQGGVKMLDLAHSLRKEMEKDVSRGIGDPLETPLSVLFECFEGEQAWSFGKRREQLQQEHDDADKAWKTRGAAMRTTREKNETESQRALRSRHDEAKRALQAFDSEPLQWSVLLDKMVKENGVLTGPVAAGLPNALAAACVDTRFSGADGGGKAQQQKFVGWLLHGETFAEGLQTGKQRKQMVQDAVTYMAQRQPQALSAFMQYVMSDKRNAPSDAWYQGASKVSGKTSQVTPVVGINPVAEEVMGWCLDLDDEVVKSDSFQNAVAAGMQGTGKHAALWTEFLAPKERRVGDEAFVGGWGVLAQTVAAVGAFKASVGRPSSSGPTPLPSAVASSMGATGQSPPLPSTLASSSRAQVAEPPTIAPGSPREHLGSLGSDKTVPLTGLLGTGKTDLLHAALPSPSSPQKIKGGLDRDESGGTHSYKDGATVIATATFDELSQQWQVSFTQDAKGKYTVQTADAGEMMSVDVANKQYERIGRGAFENADSWADRHTMSSLATPKVMEDYCKDIAASRSM